MEVLDKIPTTKIERAAKIFTTGAKVGVNYVKYFSERITSPEGLAKSNLDKNNANDIYNGLKNLKGSALKMAQMMSMDKTVLPQEYIDKFSLSQFSVPPLSGPLVEKTFKKYLGSTPSQIFDEFNATATHAASIGQVHEAWLNGKKLAVKIQYPGVAESVKSDLALIKPVALKILNLDAKGSEMYFKEVEEKLLEETNYTLELNQAIELIERCNHLPGVVFATYHAALSSSKIITMDWMNGTHLSELSKTDAPQKVKNAVGQSLWDFYMYQIHHLKKFHADPHPGNFLVSENNKLVVLDFGCIKEIPSHFYTSYFKLANLQTLSNKKAFENELYKLEILLPSDTEKEIQLISSVFHQLLTLFSKPLNADVFDFSDPQFFEDLTALGLILSKNKELQQLNANRGSKHFLYMNRTFFGLYNLMFELNAQNIKINNYQKFI